MGSIVEICNMALGHISAKNIVSLTEASEAARKCNLFYPKARNEVLRAHYWNFALKEQALSELAEDPPLGWDYLYQYPSLCLNLRRIYNEATVNSPDPSEFKILNSGGKKAIAAKIDEAYAEFTVEVTDPNLYDHNFEMALSFYLASLLAKPLTGSDTTGDNMLQKFRASIDQARGANKNENYAKPVRTSKYLSARGG